MTEKIVTIGQKQAAVTLARDGVTIRSGEHELSLLAIDESEVQLCVDGRTVIVPYAVNGSAVSFSYGGVIWFADVADKGARAKARHRDQSTSAPMPGSVMKILVHVGDVVTRGSTLLILEAMKMEHQIVAPREGTVAAVHCREGELVQPGVELVTFEDESHGEVVIPSGGERA